MKSKKLHKKSRALHPDRNKDADESTQKNNHDKLTLLNTAYGVLCKGEKDTSLSNQDVEEHYSPSTSLLKKLKTLIETLNQNQTKDENFFQQVIL